MQFLERGRLSRDFILTFLARVGVTGAGALAGIVLARLLGAEEYGRFSLAYALIFLILLPVKFGLDGASVRFVAHYIAVKDFASLVGFLRFSRRFIWMMCAGVVVLLMSVAVVWLEDERQQFFLLLAALPSFVFIAQIHFDQQVLNGLHKTAYAPVPEGGIRAILLVISIAVVFFLSNMVLNAELALLLNAFALFFALIFSRSIVKIFTKSYRSDTIPDLKEKKRWLATGYSHLLISCSHVILSQTDVCMLGLMSGSRSVGLYAVGLQLSTFLLFFANAINPVVTPRMSSAFSRGDMQRLFHFARVGTNLAFWATFPIFLLFFFFRETFIEFLFGFEYIDATQVVALLLLAQLAKVISSPIGFVYTMTDQEKIASRVIGAAAVINIILNLSLIPQYGAIGAALSTAVSAFLWNITLIALAKRRYGVLLLPGLFSKMPEGVR